MLDRLRELFRGTETDPVRVQRQRLLDILLMVIMLGDVSGLAVLALVPAEFRDAGRAEIRGLLLGLAIVAITVPILFWLGRRVSQRLASGLLLLILIVVATVSDEPQQVIQGRGLVLYSVPIFVAALLLRSWMSFPAAALSSLALVFLGRQAGYPLPNFYSILLFLMLATIAWLAARGSEQAAGEIRNSENQLLLLTHHLPAMVAYVGPDEVCRFANNRFSDYFGLPAETVAGRSLREVLDDDGYAIVKPHVDAALAGRAVAEDTQASFDLVGTRWLEITYVPDKDEHGRVRGLVIMASDVTARRNAEETLRHHEQILQETGKIAKVGGWEFDPLTLEGTWTDEVARIHDLDPGLPTNAEMGLSFYQGESRRLIDEAVGNAIQHGTPYDLELELVTALGNHKWVRTIGNPTVENGKVVRVRGAFQDISDMRLADEKLRRSEARYRSLFENMLEGYAFCRMDYDEDGAPADFVYLDVNPSFGTLTGLSDVVGRPVSEVIPGIRQANPELFEIYGRVARTGVPERFETYLDSLKIWFSISVFRPQPDHFVAVFDNITERKRADEALRASEALQRAIVACSPLPIFSLDPQSRVVTWNASAERVFGWRADEVIGKAVPIIPAGREAEFDGLRRRVLSGERVIGVELVRQKKGGELFDVSVSAAPIQDSAGRVLGIMASLEDISQRKRAEARIRESEERFRGTFEQAAVGMSHVSLDGRFLRVNRRLCEIVGYSPEELSGMTFRELTHPDDLEADLAQMRRLLAGEIRDYALEKRYRRKDGSLIWVNLTVTLSEASAEGAYFISVVEDITARKAVEDEVRALNRDLEQRVRERAAELSDLYNNAPCGYHSLDKDGVFVRINDTELTWLGYNRDEIVGKTRVTDLLTPASVDAFRQNFPEFKVRGWLKDLELEFVRRDGSILPTLVDASAITDLMGGYVMSRTTVIDATERKRAEKLQREAHARLEVANRELESFAYSVSHDLRAPLRGIDGWSLALLEDYQAQLDAKAQGYLNRIRGEAQRMGTLIDDLLRISRVSRVEMEMGQVDLSSLAQQIGDRLRREQPGRQVDLAVAPGLTAQGDARLLEVALTNLLDNAWKFTGPRPQARIEFGRSERDGRSVFFVRDNGVGFDMAYASKLFGAFQRLHRQSEFPGTGIGLATVQRVIHRHGGDVWAEAEPDRGAVFYFTLPEGA